MNPKRPTTLAATALFAAKVWARVAKSLDREAERLNKIGNPYA